MGIYPEGNFSILGDSLSHGESNNQGSRRTNIARKDLTLLVLYQSWEKKVSGLGKKGVRLASWQCYPFPMPRKPRIHYPGALYHVMLRGNGGCGVFADDKDRYRFFLLLQEGIEKFGCRVYAYCLMDNHYLC